ncbi:MAG: HesA/MoeB/ThiF family protein [Candidatus Wallbacteria bacterium]|nr:HesA/MoeB/ThiF family protein [Candidatus Wallbacteria bacterium]
MEPERYATQTLLPEIGYSGQKLIRASSVLILGAGAVGSHLAGILTRCGVGKIRLIDSDRVEIGNLQRQNLFDEHSVGILKVEAAAEKLLRINPGICIETVKARISSFAELLDHAAGMDVLLDASDNQKARIMLNQVALRLGIPWVHTAVAGHSGQCACFCLSGGPCYACFMPAVSENTKLSDAQSSGILNPAIGMAASLSASMALKLLLKTPPDREVLFFDAWVPEIRRMELNKDPHCRACSSR